MDSLVGLTINNFQIIELTGRGGMSSVYLASDKELERSVALKIPHTRFIDNPDFVKRFRREAKAMARLRHPNIVQIYSVGNHGEMPYFAMEYVHGEPLSKIIKRDGPLKIDRALNYIVQIARAVEYAHRMDVVHRDIKPANILVDSSGRVLVTDFGVSKMLSDESTQDTMGFVGTPQYMSPEQCGQGILDHRTDIYSLGAVFFEMLTGQPPFSSNSPAETIKKQLFDSPEFSEEAKIRIPEPIQTIVCRMLAKDPEERQPDIPTFLQDIERFVKECDSPTFEELDNATTRSNGSTTKDFISNVNGHRTRWPLFAFSGFVAVCLVVFSTSFTLSKGGGFHFKEVTNPISGDKASDAIAAAFRPNTGENDGDVSDDKTLKASAGTRSAHTEGKETESTTITSVTPGTESGTQSGALAARSAGASSKPALATSRPLLTKFDPAATEGPKWTKVEISTNPPGADVFFDSEPMGKTPLTLPKVALGKRVLSMKLDGYPDYPGETLDVTPQTTQVFYDFEAAKETLIPKGSLAIDSVPSGAEVYLDGKLQGVTPLALSDIQAKEYRIELRRDDYEAFEQKITLKPDDNLRLSLNLVEKPKFGDLSILSQPDGAEVLLNGAYKGITPLVLRRLPVGNYEVVLQKEGYTPVSKEIACKKNVMRKLKESMQMTPQFEAQQHIIEGDKYMSESHFKEAIASYGQGISLDPYVTAYKEKLELARRALVVEQVRDVLGRYDLAYEQENTELLASLLDPNSPDFVLAQISNAEKLFSEFENISMTLSSINIGSDLGGRVIVQFHLSVNASFAETGIAVALLDTDQKLTFCKTSEDSWKICMIE